jgi:hypothetical protein
MGCNSDYMRATDLEINAARVATLLDEIDGKPWNQNHFSGYHPLTYCKTTKALLDDLTQLLCGKLQNLDVTKYSLEMRMWWRDHQIADDARIEHEARMAQIDAEKKAALEKLTPHERKLLGI